MTLNQLLQFFIVHQYYNTIIVLMLRNVTIYHDYDFLSSGWWFQPL